jgi:DNA-binding response OmpR family regulator
LKQVLIISKEWKLRSYLKAELLERGIDSLCFEHVNEVPDRLENFQVVFIDCKGQSISELQGWATKIVTKLILLDCPLKGEKIINLTRPLTVGDCVEKIMEIIE